MAQYEEQLAEAGFEGTHQLQRLFTEGQATLKKASFDDFDRFGFTRDVLNPIASLLLKAQEVMNIEFTDEVEELPIPVNMRAPHLFAPHFLNSSYFKQNSGYKNKVAAQELGEVLFFDPILSGNNQRACVSCHSPQLAFAENRPKSLMFDGKKDLPRNSLSLVNAVYTENFFYDLRAGNLRTQFEHVFLNPDEFNTNYAELEEKLNNCDDYQQLFQAAFSLNDKRITKEHVQVALAAYVSTLTSFDSPFDKMIRGEREAEPSVAAGYNLFMGKAQCGTCHFPPTFAGLRPPFYDESESEVLGVTATANFDHPVLDKDNGRIASGRPKDRVEYLQHSFKTVSVRNIEKTAPYFHNGAFATLEEVVQFYNRGGGAGLGLEVPHQTLPADSLGLTPTEINQLISFLNSLTSLEGLTNVPATLPTCSQPELTKRTVGGQY
jgi:cytochrome c peroxidase